MKVYKIMSVGIRRDPDGKPYGFNVSCKEVTPKPSQSNGQPLEDADREGGRVKS